MLGACFDHQGICWVLGAVVGGGSPKDWDRPPKSNKAEASFIPGKKIKQVNPHGAQKAYQLAESTGRDELVRLWQRTAFELSLFIGRIRQ